ncbi:MAG: hypothetical protein WCJ84_00385 [Candidatus Peregrinibacteria bacterium]
MKVKISNYGFNKTAKTVSFLDYSSISLDGVLLITNVNTNAIIYNFADPTKGGTVFGNVLTLDYDTSAMSNTDPLLIYYDDGKNAPTAQEIGTAVEDNGGWIARAMLRMLKPLGIVTAGTNRLSIDVNSLPSLATNTLGTLNTLTTLTTLATMTNQSNMGGVNAFSQVKGISRTGYNSGIRSNLIFS